MIIIDHKKRFQLSISGHEFDRATEYHESNWLKVSVDISDGGLHWKAEDNCLLAYELVDLKDWLIGLRSSSRDEIRFTENELAFRYDKDNEELTVVLDFHLHPKGKNYQYGDDGDDEYLLTFKLDERRLNLLIFDVNTLIKKFPVRSGGS